MSLAVGAIPDDKICVCLVMEESMTYPVLLFQTRVYRYNNLHVYTTEAAVLVG